MVEYKIVSGQGQSAFLANLNVASGEGWELVNALESTGHIWGVIGRESVEPAIAKTTPVVEAALTDTEKTEETLG